MPAPSIARKPTGRALAALPPGFTAYEVAQPWKAALAAPADQQPGTVFHAPLGAMLDAAIILAPDPPDAERVCRLATLAVRDAILAVVPPQIPVALTPGGVAVNGGAVAGIRLAAGPALTDGAPAWLAVGVSVRVALALDAPGLTPGQTDLAEEGVETTAAALLDSLCRHLLAGIDLWLDQGAAGIDRAWREAA
jgi:biotin-(acetyl-CoA carboxylase) ligase